MVMNTTLSEWLKEQFDHNPRINQTSLAISIKVGQSTVSNWLRGVSVPDPDNCRKLAQFFGIPEERVLTLAGHLSPRQERRKAIAECHAPYGDDVTFQELHHILQQLTPEGRQEVLEYALFRLQRRGPSASEASAQSPLATGAAAPKAPH